MLAVRGRYALVGLSCCALVGIAVAFALYPLLFVGGVFAALVFLTSAPKHYICNVALILVLVTPSHVPVLTELGSLQVFLLDPFLFAVAIATLLRGSTKSRTQLFWLTVTLIAWGLLRTGTTVEAFAFLRMTSPLVLALLLRRIVAQDYDPWPLVRLYVVVSILTGILLDQGERWSGILGNPNVNGLFAGSLLLLSLRLPPSRRRTVQVILASTGLAGAKSISSLVAAAAGVLRVSTQQVQRKVRAFAVLFVPVVVAGVPMLRPDFLISFYSHVVQVDLFGPVFDDVNPLIGGGWGYAVAETLALTTSDLAGLHNVYLDWLANLGLVGVFFLTCWMVSLSQKDVTGVSVVVAVWFNTTGAGPQASWGLLSICLLTALSRSEYRNSGSASVQGRNSLGNAMSAAAQGEVCPTERDRR